MKSSILICLVFMTVVSVTAQELKENDIDSKTDDVRCIEKNYRHKTARELQQMNPEELIDEDARHWNYHVGLMDKYGMFVLDSYKERVGTKILPVLTKLAGDFASRPRSVCQEVRFFTAFGIAADVDDQIVRIRASDDGKAAILAAAQAVQRMKDFGLADHDAHPYNRYPFGLYLLDFVRQANDHDKLLRELLSDEFKVQLSDKEFFEFVEHLTLRYPTYPSWTPRVNSSRDLQKNKKRYYDAYQEFKNKTGAK